VFNKSTFFYTSAVMNNRVSEFNVPKVGVSDNLLFNWIKLPWSFGMKSGISPIRVICLMLSANCLTIGLMTD
jgi:hypothetical protein